MSVVDRSYDQSLALEERASMLLAGGIMQYGYQCGMLWGAALAAGAQAYQRYGSTPKAETAALIATQNAMESFRAQTRYIDCGDITEIDWNPESRSSGMKQIGKFFLKGGPIYCFRLAAKYAPLAYHQIEATFSGDPFEVPDPPVSCASILVRRMGGSDLHGVMAAGFAGGIGLSGSGCGALGAALWLIAMDYFKENEAKMDFNLPGTAEAVEAFLEGGDYEFDCQAIVGRKFESVQDHAAYLHDGGCESVIAALAA